MKLSTKFALFALMIIVVCSIAITIFVINYKNGSLILPKNVDAIATFAGFLQPK
ncbi:MAG: hypothetical protein RR123_01340 [Clostridia bacterium]